MSTQRTVMGLSQTTSGRIVQAVTWPDLRPADSLPARHSSPEVE